MTILLYVAAIVAANVITARTLPADIGPFLVTWGTWFIGATFILRDLVQMRYGRRVAYIAIGAALACSVAVSASLGDTLAVVAASALAFAVSESLDTEIFTRLRARTSVRIATSGVAGAVVDSCIFCVVGLSPLWSGILPWSLLPNLILGQIVVKGVLQLLAGGAWHAWGPDHRPEPAR